MTPSSQLPIELRFDNLLSEHLAAERLYYRSTFFSTLDKIVGALLIGFGTYLICSTGLQWWTVIWIPLGVLEIFNLLSLRPIQIRLWFKHNPKFRETYELSFDETNIHFRTTSIDTRLQWNHYSRLLENEAVCLLVYGPRMYSVIPKRAFKSATDLEAFKRLASSKMGVKPQGA